MEVWPGYTRFRLKHESEEEFEIRCGLPFSAVATTEQLANIHHMPLTRKECNDLEPAVLRTIVWLDKVRSRMELRNEQGRIMDATGKALNALVALRLELLSATTDGMGEANHRQ